jgi:excisionase family DNA binding protein
MKRLNILVVDDEEKVCDLFSEILREHKVTKARSGAEAIRRVKKDSFDIVFLDVVMPGMDGLEVFKTIKRINPQSSIIMMSGFAVEDKMREAMRLGAADSLTKPFDIDEILTIAQVAHYLKVHELTIYKLAKEEKIPAFKVGGQWRFKKRVLDEWIKSKTKKGK